MKNIFHGSIYDNFTPVEKIIPSYSLSVSSKSFTSSQTIYNSYDNNYNYVIFMEAITLSTSAPQKLKNREVFVKTQKISSGKRDFSVLTSAAVEIARKLNASAIITFSEELPEIQSNIPLFTSTPRKSTMIEELTRCIDENDKNIFEKVETRVRSTADNIGDAAVIAYVNDLIETGGLVIGIMRMMDNDSLIVYDLSTNRTMKKLKECTERVDSGVLRSVLKIALEIACQGREGKSYGTAFIIGDSNEVLRRSHPLVLNPFENQPGDSCSILNSECWETVKSFAQIDGVFIITGKGMIRAAGRYLDIDAKDMEVQQGLGGRHTSAAAITRDTETIAVTVSSSGGTIRIFMDGHELLKIEPDIMLVK
jgi:diadenylate cyclase